MTTIKSLFSKLPKRRPWWKRSIGALKAAMFAADPVQCERHHPCVARGTSTKNTRSNRWNVRGRKNVRQDPRFAKLRAFKLRYNLD